MSFKVQPRIEPPEPPKQKEPPKTKPPARVSKATLQEQAIASINNSELSQLLQRKEFFSLPEVAPTIRAGADEEHAGEKLLFQHTIAQHHPNPPVKNA